MGLDRRRIANTLFVTPLLFLARKLLAEDGPQSWGPEGPNANELDGDIAYEPNEEPPYVEPGYVPEPPEMPVKQGNAPTKPIPSFDAFDAKLNLARDQIAKRQFTVTISQLERLGVQKDPKREARRLFHLARAHAGKKRYAEAIRLNDKALALKPSQVTSRFNNGCYACLAKDKKGALNHLTLMVDYLAAKKSNQAKRFAKMMRTDADLETLRSSPEFVKLVQRLEKV